jgi:hypothetical protein
VRKNENGDIDVIQQSDLFDVQPAGAYVAC